MTFKRAPSMDQAVIDALVAGEVDESKAIRELALRNAGAVRVDEDALGKRAARRAELSVRGRGYHVQLSDPFALPDLPEGYHVPRALGPDERRRLVSNARFEWFGQKWDSPVCHAGPRRRELPRGRCFGCNTSFRDGDQGLALVQTEPEVVTFFHRKCFPVWVKTRRLSLDLGEVLVALAEERVIRASDRAGSDRAASEERVRAVEAANAPGEAWESPSWEEP